MNNTLSPTIKVSGNTGVTVPGLSLTLNSSLVLGYECAPLSMGMSNSYIGYCAAQFTRFGTFNTVYGYAAAQNVAGNANTYMGFRSAAYAGSASCNTFLGARTGLTCTTGSMNLVLGGNADIHTGGDAACVAVGYGATAGTMGSVAIGANTSVLGKQSVAIGYGVTLVGDGHFSVADRVRGYWANAGVASNDTYCVQVDSDVLKTTGSLAFCKPHAGNRSNALVSWNMYLGPTRARGSSDYADLYLQSANNALTRFTDRFWPGMFDFTGQHRCAFDAAPGLYVGAIVVATGRYRDLTGESQVSIDEAVPVVELCTRCDDPRIFGVVSAFEDPADPQREFRLGNMGFITAKGHDGKDTRVVVNAVGEGAIWVCDAGGPLRNGDLVTSCDAAFGGLGMRQASPQVLNSTVAKITCDCDFTSGGSPGPVETIHDGMRRAVRRAFVGCTYKC
jgi:hypothetical protein